MGRDDRNVYTYFKIETDVDQNLFNDFFLIGGTGLISEKTEVL